MKAIIYTRVSTDEQADKGFSLAHQKEVLERYCQAKGIQIVRHFQDDFSAKTFNRPEWKNLELFVSANRSSIDFVLFTKWDRFSRNTTESYRVIGKYKKMGVILNSIEQPLDTDNPDSKIMLAFYLAAPEVENDKISIRVKEGTRKALKDGYFVYKPPFGYSRVRVNGKAIIAPNSDARIVYYIFERYATGIISQRELLIEIRRKFGVKMSKTNLLHLLKRETYLGKIKIKAYRDEPEQIVEGLHEAIIPIEMFRKVQEILGEKAPFVPFSQTARDEFHLRGHLECNSCGNKLTGSRSKGKNKHYEYYHCQNGCKERHRVDLMHEELLKLLAQISLPEETLALFQALLDEQMIREKTESRALLNKYTREILEIETSIEEAEEKVFDGQLSEERFNKVLQKRQQRLDFLNSEVEYLQSEKEDISHLMEATALLLSRLDHWYEVADLDTKSKLLCSIFPENLVFDGSQYRTPKESELIRAIRGGMGYFTSSGNVKDPPENGEVYLVGLLGLEPRLFWTKTRRVASYTIDHPVNGGTKVVDGFLFENVFY